MTSRLALATLAVGEPMGQQVYERQLAQRAPDELGVGWDVDRIAVRTLRSPVPGTVRIPSRLLIGASPGLRRAAGRIIYRGHDVVHRFDLRLPPAPHPEVLTVHDVVSWRFPDEGRPPSDAATTARRASVVVCPSQFSADEVASQLGVAEPRAIHNGVDRTFFTAVPLAADELEAMGIRTPFVLHAGGCTQRKNLAGLAAAWPLVRASHPDTVLVLMGPPDERRDRLFDPLAGTIRVGRVPDAAVRGVMAAAAAVVVPSTYEGFGLPALEAMAAGVPVVAANRSSLPEVCGDAAYLVEPDGPGLADGLVAALGGGPDTRALVDRGRVRAEAFSWEASVAAHAELWRSCVG
ncbi:MAG TPA: glycosyltransferase family 1 protein [Acidimicrobiales bacterium]|nr:glycosyltransferase family 1 protein [Acidimicrobiales bacterium]